MQVKQQVDTALKSSTICPEDLEELNAILMVTTRSLDRRLRTQNLSDGPEAAERLVSMLREKYVQEEKLLSEEQWVGIVRSIQIADAAGFDVQVAEPDKYKQIMFELKRLFPKKNAAALTAVALESMEGGGLEQAISMILSNGKSPIGETEMDEATTNAVFWAAVKAVDRAEEENNPLSADVPKILHHVFDADMRHLLCREKLTTNVTCMQPRHSGAAAAAHGLSYIFDDSTHKDLPLKEGRRCEGGTCCNACSRNIFPTFASHAETSLETFPELASLTLNDLEHVSTGAILQFMRLVERVRRTIAHEYGLPLSSILPLQAYSRKYMAGKTQKGGGGGEGDYVILHTDEATHSGYHYSSVLYLSTQGEDFEGGDFVFNDPARTSDEAVNTNTKAAARTGTGKDDESPMSLAEQMRRHGREFTPFHPTRGAAVIFSSGWENMHEVEKITSGTRYSVPCFFTTCPVPEAHYQQMFVGKPKTDEDIAEDWLHLLLAHRHETPLESFGRVRELMMKWHYICTPLNEHTPASSVDEGAHA
jgi:hypothetical protein